jgi:hypothetical protein
MVTYHCTRCHHEAGSWDRQMSGGPQDRRNICLSARQHMLPGGECRGAEAVAWGDKMISTVQSVATGRPALTDPTGLFASDCQTASLGVEGVRARSTCAEVREARKHTVRHRATRSTSS